MVTKRQLDMMIPGAMAERVCKDEGGEPSRTLMSADDCTDQVQLKRENRLFDVTDPAYVLRELRLSRGNANAVNQVAPGAAEAFPRVVETDLWLSEISGGKIAGRVLMPYASVEVAPGSEPNEKTWHNAEVDGDQWSYSGELGVEKSYFRVNRGLKQKFQLPE